MASPETWVLDCDGVVWLADDPIAGAAEAVGRLRGGGIRVVFLTNNSYPERSTHLAKLARMGMESEAADLMSSPMAAARCVADGSTVLVLGGPGIFEALAGRDVEAFEPGSVPEDRHIDAVVVGFDLKFDFARLAAATTALRAGAQLIATNDDATFPAPGGVWPGAGSFLAALQTAGGVTPVVAGKPYPPMVDCVQESLPPIDVVVGDRPSTDGRLPRAVGAKFALVLTGVTPPGHGSLDPEPDMEAVDLATLVDEVLAHR